MKLPKYIEIIIQKMHGADFPVFLVGGCVRDILMGKEPRDWDLTTRAKPEELLRVFPFGKYENDFGTVLVPIKKLLSLSQVEGEIGNLSVRQAGWKLDEDELGQAVEITTYRSEQGYSDRRHPDEIRFEEKLECDLERRDFTVNAMAIGLLKNASETMSKQYALSDLGFPSDWGIIDLFGGQKDLKKKVIRAVGEPSDRFKEDALRMMRAVRFACQLGFEIEGKTERAIAKLSGSLKFVASERIREELIKILSSNEAYNGIIMLYKLKLLNYILPELLQGKGVKQDRHHIYSVWKHSLESLKHCPSKDWRVRLAALLHDVGKPKTRVVRDGIATFYNHEYMGERMVRKITKRLRFSNEDAQMINNLVRNHMFYYNVGEVTEASVRRLIKKVGKENLKHLIDLRVADRLGSGTPKAMPYKLRHLQYMMDKVQNDPVSVKMLKLNGDYMIQKMGFEQSPKMGAILDCLLAEVIEDPKLNTLGYLKKRALELDEENLEKLRQRAKETIEEKRGEDDKRIKKRHWVK